MSWNSSSTSSAPAAVQNDNSSPSVTYNYYGEGSYLPEPEETKEDSTKDSAEKIEDKNLEDDKTAPLGVTKKTDEKTSESSTMIVILLSILAVGLGVTTIVVVSRRER